ncbi:MAG: tRNA (adenosine(37)-N6)-threonylcarbamoyltransferase complex ATPase subunit type 1 TsaE [Pseudomonadota bacterium]
MTRWPPLTLTSPAETEELAGQFAPLLTRGDLLLLSGPVGAGKSHFARALIQTRMRAVGMFEDVPSPSYTLVQVYEVGGLDIWHADLYRLSDASEVHELGLTAAFETALCLIEWPERAVLEWPDTALRLTFDPGPADTARQLAFSSIRPEAPERFLPILGRADG